MITSGVQAWGAAGAAGAGEEGEVAGFILKTF